jgi:hypothetical protein
MTEFIKIARTSFLFKRLEIYVIGKSIKGVDSLMRFNNEFQKNSYHCMSIINNFNL